jgi:hypothetical protein
MSLFFLVPDINKTTGQSFVSREIMKIIYPDKIISLDRNFRKLIYNLYNLYNSNPEKLYITLSRSFFGALRDHLYIQTIKPKCIISHMHGMGFMKNNFFLNRNIHNSNTVILLTEKSTKDFKLKYPKYLGKVICIENPIFMELEVTKPFGIENNMRVYFFSNLMIEKGIIEFIKLSSIFHSSYDFHIAGRNIASIEENSIYYTYHGLLTDMKKQRFLIENHIHIFYSWYGEEFYPISLIESIMAGSLCIVKRHNDLDITFSDINIIWVDEFEEIINILSNSENIKTLYNNHIQWFRKNRFHLNERFSKNRFQNKIIEVLK